jgi:hypothetical protein
MLKNFFWCAVILAICIWYSVVYIQRGPILEEIDFGSPIIVMYAMIIGVIRVVFVTIQLFNAKGLSKKQKSVLVGCTFFTFVIGYTIWVVTPIISNRLFMRYDCPKIRLWGLKTLDTYKYILNISYAQDTDLWDGNPIDSAIPLPRYIAKLNPEVISVERDSNGNRSYSTGPPYLDMIGGSGFGHWDLIITHQDISYTAQQEDARRLAPGMYLAQTE